MYIKPDKLIFKKKKIICYNEIEWDNCAQWLYAASKSNEYSDRPLIKIFRWKWSVSNFILFCNLFLIKFWYEKTLSTKALESEIIKIIWIILGYKEEKSVIEKILNHCSTNLNSLKLAMNCLTDTHSLSNSSLSIIGSWTSPSWSFFLLP